MPADTVVAFEPRKTPVQARSTVTVEAISEATIQVLLRHGAERLTTTRVAQRAGVSVGTLYQYYPNKQSLLFAVLENHLDNVMARVEAACESACHKPLAEMIREMVEAFVDAKMKRADISVALYQVSALKPRKASFLDDLNEFQAGNNLPAFTQTDLDRKSTRLNSSHLGI